MIMTYKWCLIYSFYCVSSNITYYFKKVVLRKNNKSRIQWQNSWRIKYHFKILAVNCNIFVRWLRYIAFCHEYVFVLPKSDGDGAVFSVENLPTASILVQWPSVIQIFWCEDNTSVYCISWNALPHCNSIVWYSLVLIRASRHLHPRGPF